LPRFHDVQERPEGRISAGGVEREVAIVPPQDGVDDALDQAYLTKYARSGFVEPMVSAPARATTLRLIRV
jgi:hypothetical protein